MTYDLAWKSTRTIAQHLRAWSEAANRRAGRAICRIRTVQNTPQECFRRSLPYQTALADVTMPQAMAAPCDNFSTAFTVM
jgi:hypothetical protein